MKGCLKFLEASACPRGVQGLKLTIGGAHDHVEFVDCLNYSCHVILAPIRYSREFPPSRRCGSCIVPEAKSYPQSHRTAVPGFSSLHAGQVAVVRICISYSRYPHQCTPGCGLE